MENGFSPIRKPSLPNGLSERVTKLIQSGAYEPGDRLPPINEMARRFGVAHPTLREALKQLETVGIVEIKHGLGVYVRMIRDVLVTSNPIFGGVVSKKLMVDLIEVRMSIESRSVSLAAENVTGEQLDGMAALLDEAGNSLENDEMLNAKNMAFHRAIASASENVVLAQLLTALTDLFRREQGVIIDIYGSRHKDHEEHLGILAALRAHDAALAASRMQSHLDGVREAIVRWDPDQTPLS